MVSDISAALVALISLSSTTASLTVCGRPRERWKTARSSRKQSGSLVKSHEIHGLLPFPKGLGFGEVVFWPSNGLPTLHSGWVFMILSSCWVFMAGLFLFLDLQESPEDPLAQVSSHPHLLLHDAKVVSITRWWFASFEVCRLVLWTKICHGKSVCRPAQWHFLGPDRKWSILYHII